MKKLKPAIPFLISLFVVFLFWLKRIVVFKFYPPLINLIIFLIFFISLFTKETVIQKFVRLSGETMNEPVFAYTRNVTYLWCGFLFLNMLLTIWTIFLPDEIWIFYNGFLTYFLTGVLFGAEYIFRIFYKKRHGL